MGQEYVEITANAIETKNARAGSGGDQTITEGFFVTWNPESGFTGQGWDTGAGSPIYGLAEEAWQSDMSDGNLNDTFASWEKRVPDVWDRLDWIRALQGKNPSCAIEA